MWDYPHSSHRYSYILHPQVKSSHLVFLRWVGETSSGLISNAWCLWHFCPQIVLVIFGVFFVNGVKLSGVKVIATAKPCSQDHSGCGQSCVAVSVSVGPVHKMLENYEKTARKF